MTSLGIHVSKNGKSMNEAIGATIDWLRGHDVLHPCVQIFVCNPRTGVKSITDQDIEYMRGLDVPIIVHSSYICAPWKSTNPRATQQIFKEYALCCRIRASGYIVHGANQGADMRPTILSKILAGLDRKDRGPILYFEIPAAKGPDASLNTGGKIAAFMRAINELPNHGVEVGICIDTAHLFASGVAISSGPEVAKWLVDLDQLSTVPFILHLNDNSLQSGCGRDEHSQLFEGQIWRQFAPGKDFDSKLSGAFAFIEWAKFHANHIILERKIPNSKEIIIVNKILTNGN
jgi:endonuclease IV